MFLRKKKRGQSILEYTLLLGIVISGILIMQTFVKRHFQGGLKESGEKMGEQFSASGTTTFQKRQMTTNQTITEEVATNSSTAGGIGAIVGNLTGTVDKGVYSLSEREGGDSIVEQKAATESATQEKFKFSEHPNTTFADFNSTNITF